MACLLFKGLPSSFDSFASRKYEELAKDIANINISKLIADLISEEARITSNINLEANKTASNTPICRYCRKSGHLEAKCYKKYPELRPNNPNNSKNPKTSKFNKDKNKDKNKANKEVKTESSRVIMSAFSTYNRGKSTPNKTKNSAFNATNTFSKYCFILDSSAIKYYTLNREYLMNYKLVKNRTIIVANSATLAIKRVGNILIRIDNYNLLIKNINYIPELQHILISTRELIIKN